ncbi:tetratricopeptide repeat protein [Candidatus Dependentiae bacterium]|nr:tetratricopeptide repeat protein [Candidatus Dependentiae bacterium]MCC7414847.1 tetratricopeptide repeat protein [Campylobacterota bacterium]
MNGIGRLSFILFFFVPCSACNVDALHNYLWANYCQFEGNYTTAAVWYDKLFLGDAPVHVYKGYLTFLYDTGDYPKIAGLASIVEKKFEQDADIQLLLAQSLDKVGQQQTAYEKIVALSRSFTTHPEIVFQAVHVHMQRKQPELALAALDTFLNSSPRKTSNFIFYFMKSQIYLQLGKPGQALAQVKECLDMHPGFGKGWLMLALLEEQQGRLDQAIKGYTAYLETDALGNKQIQQHLVELTFRQQVALRQQEQLVMHKSTFDKAIHFFDAKEYTQAIRFVDEALQEKPHDEQIRFFKITILSSMGSHVAAAELLKTWMLADPTQEVWFSSLHLLCRSGLAHQKAIAVLEDISKKHPKELLPLLYLIDITTRVGSSGSLVRSYEKALARAESADLKARLYFHLAHVHYKHKKYDTMRDVLEKANALGVDFPHVQNMLAYYYATGSRDLDRAQELMSAILVNHKNNPYFQDTQAFIYYKQKRYDKALAILELVSVKIPNNFDAVKHLGKTYFKLGMKDKAVTTLERANTLAKSDDEKHTCTNLLGCWRAQSY